MTPNNETTLQSMRKSALDHMIFPIVSREQMAEEGPRIFARGEGCRLWTEDGHEFLDMLGSPTRANSLGYANQEMAQAVYDQLVKVHFVGSRENTTATAIQLAEKLSTLLPGDLSRIFFVSTGSEAVEGALKLAKQYHQAKGKKPRAYKVISRWNAYHGATMGCLSVTDWLPVREIQDPRLVGHSFVPSPTRYRNPFHLPDEAWADMCATYLERQIELEGPDTVAAFIGEPIMQANGVQIPVKSYWKRVRDICSKYDILLICDEIITGFGRTGSWFACEHFGIVPDILTMAKAMSAGYVPAGAVATRPDIADAIPMYRNVHTYSGHAGAMAACLKAIEIKEREGLIGRARANGEYFLGKLQAQLASSPIVGEVRGIGHWHAIDFTSNKETREPFKDDTVKSVMRSIRRKGVLTTAVGHSIEMAPPLIATRQELDTAVRVTAEAIQEVADARSAA
jgi:adenosylmethionine-8-amino-7-oxononanoate aminotransferase